MSTVPFYILLGESNTGWTPAKDMTAEEKTMYNGVIPQTDIWNPARGASAAKIEPLTIGFNTMCENYADLTQFGQEVSFFKSLQNQQPKQRFLYKQGQANTSLVLDWKPMFPYAGGDGARWQQLTEWLPIAVSQANAKGYQLDLKAVFWIGGENDSKPPAGDRAKVYLTALTNLFAAVHNLWQGLVAQYGFPNNPYKRIVGKVYAPGAAFPFRDLVRAAQAEYCAHPENNAVLIDTDNYPLADYAHYDTTGMLKYGIEIFNVSKCEPITGSPSNTVSFSGKVYLQGAFNPGTGVMNTTLNNTGILQSQAATQPFNVPPFNYTGSESVSSNFFTSNPDVVDWVLIELRNSSNPATVVTAKAALVKTDGTLIEADGSGTQIKFSISSPGAYFIVVRHRNHLGIRSSSPVDFASGSGNYDFTTDGTKAFQNQSYTSTIQVGNVWLMRAGNASVNSDVKYNGPQNDQDHILNNALGGSLGKIVTNAYLSDDLNMDGKVKVNGPGNDQDFLLNTVLGGSVGKVYTEQI